MLGTHLLGLYEKALPEQYSLSEKLEIVKALGFDFMEISIDETDARLARLYWTREEKEDLKKVLSLSGIPLQSMCLSAHRRYPLGSVSEQTRLKAREITERAILFANEFGIRVIQLAAYDVYYEQSTEETVHEFIEGLKWACTIAEQYQIMLALEIMDTKLVSSVSRYIKLCEQINSPWFTVYPDIGNLSAWKDNDVIHELRIGRRDMVAVHIKETVKETDSTPGIFKRVPFGSGCVDFVGIFRELERLKYRGPYMMEMWYSPGDGGIANIQSAKRYIEACFAEACGGLQ